MSASDIRNKVLPEIDLQRKKADAAKMRFTALNEQQLTARVTPRSLPGQPIPVALPMIVWQAWFGAANPGSTVGYSFGIYNPSPMQQSWLFAHAFVGPANFVWDPGHAVQAVDNRFPRLSEPVFPGLDVGAGATTSLHFDLTVPMGIEPSNYLGNTFLFRAEWHDVGAYIDRGLWPFAVG